MESRKADVVPIELQLGPNDDKAAKPNRMPPHMQVVTKGWWILREERASADALAREDMNEH